MTIPAELFTVMWRVTVWKPTEDRRWRVDAVSDHPAGDWRSALTVAREWTRYLVDDIEAGRLRIKVDPVMSQAGGESFVSRGRQEGGQVSGQRAVAHIADHGGVGLCGAKLDTNLAGSFATCEDCWRLYREERKRKEAQQGGEE